ncbi:MAG: aryl-sulfate sulfotransferase, partial [Limisphaerales bacterium]
MRITCKVFVAAAITLGLLVFNAAATPTISALNPSPAGAHPVGTTVTWTVAASDSDSGALWYRFSVGSHNGTLQVVKDYNISNTFLWTPTQNEGGFDIEVSVENSVTKNVSAAAIQTYTVTSRVTGGTPVITPTSNSLIALYSAPPCLVGSTMRVRFRPSTPVYTNDNYDQSTPVEPCNGVTSMNFYIAGMRANTAYIIRHDLFSGPRVVTGPTLSFSAGAAPTPFPSRTVVAPPQLPTSLTNGILLQAVLNFSAAFATDLNGNVVWYYRFPNPSASQSITTPLPGGGVLYTSGLPGGGRTQSYLRATDVAGNTTAETNAATVDDQLAAMGEPPINGFHHDARPMPGGGFLALAATEKLFTDGTQGSSPTRPVDVLGDVILVLDKNLHVVWYWSDFDHLNVNRAALLGETCTASQGGCPQIFLASVANDWTHGNTVELCSDGDILYSARHQDFVYKIDYRNGAGTGNLVWTLGNGGDFAMTPNNSNLWFSHQHDPEFQLGGTTVLSLFDNGNTRIAAHGGNSRGQVLVLDEAHRTVSLQLNVDLGVNSPALGAAQRLPNGNYHFDAGEVPAFLGGADSFEFTPS